MHIMTLSGWGQHADSLASLVEAGDHKALHIHYRNFEGPKELFPFIKDKPCDVLMGWSLGGQLAVRAVHEGILKPKVLVLVSTAFTFISEEDGMPLKTFNTFEQTMYKQPEKTLRRFASLVAQGDSKAKEITKVLTTPELAPEGWLLWLKELRHFSSESVDFAHFPKTLLVHGKKDGVVPVKQSHYFHALLPQCQMVVLEDAGHAPHLHNPAFIRQRIKEEIQSLDHELSAV